jgi:hypothetical protein
MVHPTVCSRLSTSRNSRMTVTSTPRRAGYVYVISNLGAFGPKVVKIGMTRRLEPMDRVRELGDASVPFPFDVHALYFSDDAVTLETELHHAFAPNRLNYVNARRDFSSRRRPNWPSGIRRASWPRSRGFCLLLSVHGAGCGAGCKDRDTSRPPRSRGGRTASSVNPSGRYAHETVDNRRSPAHGTVRPESGGSRRGGARRSRSLNA